MNANLLKGTWIVCYQIYSYRDHKNVVTRTKVNSKFLLLLIDHKKKRFVYKKVLKVIAFSLCSEFSITES